MTTNQRALTSPKTGPTFEVRESSPPPFLPPPQPAPAFFLAQFLFFASPRLSAIGWSLSSARPLLGAVEQIGAEATALPAGPARSLQRRYHRRFEPSLAPRQN